MIRTVCSLGLAASALSGAVRAQAPAPSASGPLTTVIILGRGMPRPDPSASGPATAVLVGGTRLFLFDAGSSVERQLAAAHLAINGPEATFITHLHSDHTVGYPDLILTSWVMGRRRPLPVYGPRGLQAMTDHILAAWSEDIRVRTEGLEHETKGGQAVDVHEVSIGVVYDSAGVRVTAFPVDHGSVRPAFGYRLDAPDRSIVISGDTRPSSTLEAASANVDVLVHEVYSASHLKPEDRPGGDDWPTYMHAFHTSDRELGDLASRIRPGLLILTHLIRMGASDSEFVAGVREGGFTGPVVVAEDLGRY